MHLKLELFHSINRPQLLRSLYLARRHFNRLLFVALVVRSQKYRLMLQKVGYLVRFSQQPDAFCWSFSGSFYFGKTFENRLKMRIHGHDLSPKVVKFALSFGIIPCGFVLIEVWQLLFSLLRKGVPFRGVS